MQTLLRMLSNRVEQVVGSICRWVKRMEVMGGQRRVRDRPSKGAYVLRRACKPDQISTRQPFGIRSQSTCLPAVTRCRTLTGTSRKRYAVDLPCDKPETLKERCLVSKRDFRVPESSPTPSSVPQVTSSHGRRRSRKSLRTPPRIMPIPCLLVALGSSWRWIWEWEVGSKPFQRCEFGRGQR